MIYVVIAAICLAAFFYFASNQSKKLANPIDQSVVYLDELPSLIILCDDGAFVLNVYRQSGNPHADGKVFESRDAAIAAALSTFRRAQIDAVAVHENTTNKLNVSRAFFDNRGRAEGKKVGAFEIIRVA